MSTNGRPLTSIAIVDRPKGSYDTVRSVAFNLFFLYALVSLHGFQLLTSVIWLSPPTRPLFWQMERWLKSVFGTLLVFITQGFAPTKIRLTAEGDINLDRIAKRDATGRVVSLDLPDRAVVMANHQVYCDWLYCWTLLHLAYLDRGITIILKASLKFVPIVGPAMQLFQFIFIARKWEQDRVVLAEKLLKMGRLAEEEGKAFSLVIYPEGTLVSPLTRPTSKAYADKTGVEDLKHSLLPRSTGLLFCLRGLARATPDLQLVDLTIGYPGIPADHYGQSYYTLQSIYGHGQPPPVIHIHLRSYDVATLPLGELPKTHDAEAIADAPATERKKFDLWLQARWVEKDAKLGEFYRDGSFKGQQADEAVEIEVKADNTDLAVMFSLMAISTFAYWHIFRLLLRLVWR